MKRITLLALFGAVLCTPSERTTAQTLTLEEALVRTLTENPALQAARWAEEAADRERQAAIGLRAPEVGVTGSYLHLNRAVGIDLNHLKQPLSALLPSGSLPLVGELLEPLMQAEWSLPLQRRNFGSVVGYVTLPVWMGGRINAANRAARLNLAVARSEGRQTEQQLITELIERYYGLALAQRVAMVREEAVRAMQRHLEDALALEQNGVIAHADRLYVEVKRAEAQRALEQAELEIATLRRALSTTLGSTMAVDPVTPLFVVDDLPSVAHFRALAEAANPQLDRLQLDRRLAEEGVRIRRADFLPEVVVGGAGVLFQDHLSELIPRGVVGVGVRIRLFNGLNREYRYAAAKAVVRRIEELQTKAGDEVTLLVEMRYNALVEARTRFGSLASSLRFAEEYRRMRQTAFREGVGGATELMDAEVELAAIRVERLEAAYRFVCALAQLLEAAGVSDTFTDYLTGGGGAVHLLSDESV